MSRPEPSGRLSAAALTLERIHAIVGCVAIWVLAAGAVWLWPEVAWIGLAALVAGVLALVATAVDVVWLLSRRLASYRYEVSDHAVRIHHGIWFSRRLIVPAEQVLYLALRQGPVQRRFGLATVQVGTLGSVHDLGPLPFDVAAAITDHHLERQPSDAAL